MSMSYWICEGVGIRVNQLRPFLNPQKCIQLSAFLPVGADRK